MWNSRIANRLPLPLMTTGRPVDRQRSPVSWTGFTPGRSFCIAEVRRSWVGVIVSFRLLFASYIIQTGNESKSFLPKKIIDIDGPDSWGLSGPHGTPT